MPCELLIVESDRPVPPAAGRWLAGEIVVIKDTPANWGVIELATSQFFRFGVTDKTAAEMEAYMQQYNRIYAFEVIAGPDPEGLRRIEITNQMVNVSETLGAWSQELIDNILAAWNGLYPESELISISFTNRVWTCQGKFTSGQAEEFEQVITAEGFSFMDKRKRWYITPFGMQNIRDNGGYQEGTAQQLGQILRDGTLD